MKITITFYLHALLLFSAHLFAQDQPPVVTATGNQIYCPGTPQNIVLPGNFIITDPDDTGTNAIYIQISSGYVNGQDQLSLGTNIPNVTSSWNAATGKLILSGVGGQEVPYTTLITAVENVMYNSSAANPTGTRTFSITVGEANYLPSTDHYYKFIPQAGISWTAAKTAAENSNYYGLQGYLATLLSAEEAQLCGEQSSGNGWIGGSDAQTEGVWRWVTGPEAGTIFWNGGANGSTPNYAKWNTGEPNNLGEEDYAHVTAPGLGITGSWNDLTDSGGAGEYAAQGYIVEYGGMPGDPVLQISGSTTITIPTVTATTPGSVCGQGSVALSATVSAGTPHWYAAATGGSVLATGDDFNTPVLTATTTYYVSAYDETCTTATRTAVVATANEIPTITADAGLTSCDNEPYTLEATTTVGQIYWYDTPTGGQVIAQGSPASFDNTQLQLTAVYVTAINNGCQPATRQEVTLTAYASPPTSATIEAEFCEGDDVTLTAGTTGLTYLWNTGETTEAIVVTQPGNYEVEITNANGCSNVQAFTVEMISAPHITNVDFTNNSATIVLQNTDVENFEFSIDGTNYQASPTFNNLAAGQYTGYVRSELQCGEDSKPFVIYLIPKVFTPNGDAVNDGFTIAGMSALPQANVYILDRYGKLIVQLNRSNPRWDGTLDGNPAPATDYWYVIKIDNQTPEIRGHFALVR